MATKKGSAGKESRASAKPVPAGNGVIAAAPFPGQKPGRPDAAQLCMSMGAVLELMRLSPIHRYLYVSDLDWLVVPPLLLGQTRMYHDENKPVAFVCWAMLDEETEARVKAGQVRLRPTDWQSGDRPWVMETIAPYGGFERVIDDLTKTVFGGKRPHLVGEKP